MDHGAADEGHLDNETDGRNDLVSGWTSDYASSVSEASFCSVSSSVNAHVWEYGRRYQIFRYGRYPIPNDDEEFKRETFKHVMFKEMLHGKLYLAPLGETPQKIIDLGTGFGEWAIEFGDAYPSAMVLGVDLSPIQPMWLPPNVEFVVDDIEDEWAQDSDFDYVHSRSVFVFLRDAQKVISNAFRNMKPGGWIEFLEFCGLPGCDDGTLGPDSPLIKFFNLLRQVFVDVYGFDINIAEKIPAKLEQAGFTNIQQKVYHLPIGDWPKDKHLRTVGVYCREVVEELLSAAAAKPFSDAGIEKSEANELLQESRAVLFNKRVHAYMPAYIIWAQKPER